MVVSEMSNKEIRIQRRAFITSSLELAGESNTYKVYLLNQAYKEIT